MSTERRNKEKSRSELLREFSVLRTKRDPSTRTSFAFTPDGLEAFASLMKKQQMSAKEVFADMGEALQPGGPLNDFLENLLTEEVRNRQGKVGSPQIRKSFVIPRSVLSRLNGISKDKKLKRDLVVETLTIFFSELVDKDYKATYEAQKNAHHVFNSAISSFFEAFLQVSETLPKEDPVLGAFLEAISFAQVRASNVEDALTDGTPVTQYIG